MIGTSRFRLLSLVPHLAPAATASGAFFDGFLLAKPKIGAYEFDMIHDPTDAFLRDLLTRTKTIACVGVSANPVRPSHFVARYLTQRGYRVIPVNPGTAGQTLFGQTVRASLAECADDGIEMVDVFRKSDAVPEILEQALFHLKPTLQSIWLQIGVQHDAAGERARSEGLDFVQNRCPKIEYQRLFGELRKAGFNTGIISSRL